MLPCAHILSDVFLTLRSGLAGVVLQNLANYQVKTAIILASERRQNKRFSELVYELNQSSHCRYLVTKKEQNSGLPHS